MNRRTRGRGADHERRRLEIVDAVLSVVEENGLAAVSQSSVAARADVSPGRVQHYFPARHELIEAAFDRANALSAARIAERSGSETEPRRMLEVVLTELIPYDTFTRTHLRVRQSFTALALSEEAIASRMRCDYERLYEELADLLRRDRESGRVPAETDPRDEAVSLVALAEGFAYHVLLDLIDPAVPRARVLGAIADLYGSGEGRATTDPEG
ncbi:TetR/AcrR family transcriptional regulator [Nocardiopsis alba]|nr:TetR/AcrR family transcriptional regulator [Nocardiopsis alba]